MCSTIALYGMGTLSPARLREVYNSLVKWFHGSGATLDRLGIRGPRYPKKVIGTFKRGNAQLAQGAFAGVESLFLFCLEEGATVPVEHWKAEAGITPTCCYLTAGGEITKGRGLDSFMDVMIQLVDCGDPAYGIGYDRPRYLGPQYYAIGLNYGLRPTGPDRDEAWRIDAWGKTGLRENVYRKGLLRDVYEWNLLTAYQLSAPIAGRSLAEWLRSAAGRGQLVPMPRDAVLWQLDQGEIPGVREELARAGLLFNPLS